MGWKNPRITHGETITGAKPGERISEAIEELQGRCITNISSSVKGYEFVPSGNNTMEFRPSAAPKGEEQERAVVKKGSVTTGSVGDINVRERNGTYYLDVTFPVGPAATGGGDGSDGGDGEPGQSPYITFEDLSGEPGGVRIVCHNPDGTIQLYDIYNGAKGDRGPAGHNGLVHDVDTEATWTGLDPNGQPTLDIVGGKLVLTLKTLEYNLAADEHGTLKVEQNAGADITATGPDIATCVAFDDGSS